MLDVKSIQRLSLKAKINKMGVLVLAMNIIHPNPPPEKQDKKKKKGKGESES